MNVGSDAVGIMLYTETKYMYLHILDPVTWILSPVSLATSDISLDLRRATGYRLFTRKWFHSRAVGEHRDLR